MKKHIFTFFTLILISKTAIGQNTLESKWQQYITYLEKKYSYIPSQKLDSITIILDSTAIAKQCFKFITNSEKTKFLAFYLTDRNSSSFNSIHREYGGVYRSSTWSNKKNNQIEVFAYIVTGMYYNNKWYYDVGEYQEFYADNLDKAKNIFLIRTLTTNNYFIRDKLQENKKFWNNNDFEKNVYPYKNEYPNIPYIVVKSTITKKNHESYKLNKNIEQIACEISTNLWNNLSTSDSEKYNKRYRGKFTESFCLSLYNSERNIILLPIIYYDISNNANIIYYVLKLSSNEKTLYKWTKFKEKKINRDENNESLEVINDIRNFIINWGWGTNNMISEAEFWKNNFTENDLEISSYQYYSR